MGKLNARQKRFAAEYLIDLCASAAARRAGYSERTAGSQGFDLLKKPEIQALIEKGAEARSKRTRIDADYVMLMTNELLRRCMQKEPVLDSDGNPTGEWKFDSAGASRALKLLGDHVAIGAFKLGGDVEPAPVSGKWAVQIVHTTAESYHRALAAENAEKPVIEHKP